MSKLAHHLKERGLTQVQFAERIGITQGALSKLCGESPRLSLETAAAIERETEGAVLITDWPQFAFLADRPAPQAGAA